MGEVEERKNIFDSRLLFHALLRDMFGGVQEPEKKCSDVNQVRIEPKCDIWGSKKKIPETVGFVHSD